jgi:hypothetical protein
MRGFADAKRFHEENTGLSFKPFTIKEGAAPEQIRVLALAYEDRAYPDYPLIQSLIMHREWQILKPIRCAAVDSESPDPLTCALCAAKAPRSLRTYIPVLRRARPNEDNYKAQVQVIEYGREGVNEILAQIEELEGHNISLCDFKIKRLGKGKDTEYKWIMVPSTMRPLNDFELSLQKDVPNMDEALPVKDEITIERRAAEYRATTQQVTAVAELPAPVGDDGITQEDEIPF